MFVIIIALLAMAAFYFVLEKDWGRAAIFVLIFLIGLFVTSQFEKINSGNNDSHTGNDDGLSSPPVESESTTEVADDERESYDSEDYLHSIFMDNVCNRSFENEICFLYADYDRDGKFEAYAATGNQADYSYENVQCYEDVCLYYIDSNGKITKVAEPGTGYNGCDAYTEGKDNLLDTGTDQYFVWEWYSGGFESESTLYGVREGQYYSPKCSGLFYGFHFEEDHYEAWLDYPDYAHDRDQFWFMHDDAKREFVTIARTFREDEPRILKSLNTAHGLIAQYGSTVNIDYVELYSEAEIKRLGTSGSGVDVTIGSGESIGDFEEQLIGHKVGETFTISVDVPDDYYITDLAGKTVQFEILINGIYK